MSLLSNLNQARAYFYRMIVQDIWNRGSTGITLRDDDLAHLAHSDCLKCILISFGSSPASPEDSSKTEIVALKDFVLTPKVIASHLCGWLYFSCNPQWAVQDQGGASVATLWQMWMRVMFELLFLITHSESGIHKNVENLTCSGGSNSYTRSLTHSQTICTPGGLVAVAPMTNWTWITHSALNSADV